MVAAFLLGVSRSNDPAQSLTSASDFVRNYRLRGAPRQAQRGRGRGCYPELALGRLRA
jgi:hypothetical protein